ncbi:3-isopropylmalate dehydratase small subunit [Megalodesulfovibrio paquesii]
MTLSGTAHLVGDHIDTDAIIPAPFLVTTDPAELGKHCMEGLEPGWNTRINKGDFVVAGRNFGCGSSREHAPVALLGAGVSVVIAHSYARIFYRNSFNMGLPLLEVGDDISRIQDGDPLEVDIVTGKILNKRTGETISAQPVPAFMQGILNAGGLVGYVKERLTA